VLSFGSPLYWTDLMFDIVLGFDVFVNLRKFYRHSKVCRQLDTTQAYVGSGIMWAPLSS
jgi:hypothetical protein